VCWIFHIGNIKYNIFNAWRQWDVMRRHVMVVSIYGFNRYLIRNPSILCFTEENVPPKTDSNSGKPADDQGMRIVFTFLGVVGGLLILISIFIVSYCIHRRRNVNKQINNGMCSWYSIIQKRSHRQGFLKKRMMLWWLIVVVKHCYRLILLLLM